MNRIIASLLLHTVSILSSAIGVVLVIGLLLRFDPKLFSWLNPERAGWLMTLAGSWIVFTGLSMRARARARTRVRTPHLRVLPVGAPRVLHGRPSA